MNKNLILIIVLLVTNVSKGKLVAVKADRCQETATEVAVINIALNYPIGSRLFLRNPSNDLRLMEKIFQRYKKQINITDTKNKSSLIKNISDFVSKNKAEGISNFVLNYSGHGGVTKDKKEFALILNQYDCTLGNVTGNTIPSTTRGLGPKEDFNPRINDNSILNTDRVDLIDTTNSKCESQILTASEIKQIFSGVKLTALIDSCFSGLFSETEGINTVYSAGKNETSKDGEKFGSPFFRSLNEVSEMFYCSYFRTDNNFPQVTLLDFVENLPVVYGKVLSEVVSTQSELESKIKSKITAEFNQFKDQLPGTDHGFSSKDSCIKMDPIILDINKCDFKSVEITSAVNCGPQMLNKNDKVKFLNFATYNNQKIAHVYNDECGLFNISVDKLNINPKDRSWESSYAPSQKIENSSVKTQN